MAGAMASGSGIGLGVGGLAGSFGFVGGPTGLVTEPVGLQLGLTIGGTVGTGVGYVTCKTGGGGGSGGGSSGSSSSSKVRFGNNPNQEYHTFRHVEEAGIDKQAAENAIKNDLAGKEASLPQGLTSGEVNVAGKTLRYNAFKLSDGTINVGRITVH